MLKIGFIGLGLIGGSLAKALRCYRNDAVIHAYDINTESLQLALQEHTIDAMVEDTSDFPVYFNHCDYIFLCTSVENFRQFLPKLKGLLTPDTILSDVGSVKGYVHKEISAFGLDSSFIGGHPMAGSEKSGYQYSSADFLKNAYYLLTPSSTCDTAKQERYQALVTDLQAKPLVLSYEEHDRLVAAISHLPHAAAAAMVGLALSKDKTGDLKMVAAGGFKDITRIASSNSALWQNISLANKSALLEMLDSYIGILTEFRNKLANEDGQGLYDIFRKAKEYRDGID
ncbi:MAG: prephenate dehydrogenase/arogenate dehydrogenase family protein [Lachnospiraceae bacterium]|nr:prephenate dehydrogenase/arogenate dehydrogenase family protein [Lachnospiraceae bacterium]